MKPTTERTAPRLVKDCPVPRDPDGWKREDLLSPAGFDDPAKAIDWAGSLEHRAQFLRLGAAVALVEEHGLIEAARMAGISVDGLESQLGLQRRTRERLEYSQAYYARHPDRRPGEWYPVEDDDPELPESGAGVGTRHAPTGSPR